MPKTKSYAQLHKFKKALRYYQPHLQRAFATSGTLALEQIASSLTEQTGIKFTSETTNWLLQNLRELKPDSLSSQLPNYWQYNTNPHKTNSTTTYKYQKLRNKLRTDIESGELKGKIPGERRLAKVYQANQKTISKALDELAEEQLLTRNVGTGTYVKESSSQETKELEEQRTELKAAQTLLSLIIEDKLNEPLSPANSG